MFSDAVNQLFGTALSIHLNMADVAAIIEMECQGKGDDRMYHWLKTVGHYVSYFYRLRLRLAEGIERIEPPCAPQVSVIGCDLPQRRQHGL